MPEIMTIEGLPASTTPGRKYSRAKGIREVVKVKASPAYLARGERVCVAAEYGPRTESGRRMADLCRGENFDTMLAGGRKVRIDGGQEGTMADYDDVEFPPIEDLEAMDQAIPPGFLRDGAISIGAYVGARLLGDATKALPGPDLLKPVAKGLAGLIGGRLLWNIQNDAAKIALATLAGGALYDDLLKPFVLSKTGLAIFGDALPETRLLGQLTEEEKALLEGANMCSLSGNVEEEVLSGDVPEADGRRENIEIGSWLQ